MSEMVEMIEQYEDDGFSINDDRGAEYALKRIRETQAEVDKFKDYYAESIAKMQERADGIRAFYEAHLERYFGKVPHKTSKTQESYELPSGKLIRKQQAPEFVREEDKLLGFLHENGLTGYIKVKENVDWAEMKKVCTVVGEDVCLNFTGEVVPGVKAVAREPKFDVSFKKEG